MKIAIAGYGIEGESNYSYWNTSGNDVTIVDANETPSRVLPGSAKTIIGQDAFSKLDGFDMVVRTAGLSPRSIQTDGKIWSATNEFFAKCPALIIGVTGSKGKGTTCSLIASMLRSGGKTVHLVGNIGLPALDVLDQIQPDDIVVYELSSFQLWDIEYSPHVAVVLHIEPDHLDVHDNFSDYVIAKSSIARFQTIEDTIVFNTTNIESQTIADLSIAHHVPYQSDEAVHIANGWFYDNEQKLCSVDELNIPGLHNQDNACAAIAAVREWVTDGGVIAKGLRAFEGLPHRLKFVKTVNGVRFFDDSIATTPGSAIAALKSFREPTIIILGGSSKGSDFTELATVAQEEHVKFAVVVGEDAPRLETFLSKQDMAVVNGGRDISMHKMLELV